MLSNWLSSQHRPLFLLYGLLHGLLLTVENRHHAGHPKIPRYRSRTRRRTSQWSHLRWSSLRSLLQLNPHKIFLQEVKYFSIQAWNINHQRLCPSCGWTYLHREFLLPPYLQITAGSRCGSRQHFESCHHQVALSNRNQWISGQLHLNGHFFRAILRVILRLRPFPDNQ
jgi:hypothetical protein